MYVYLHGFASGPQSRKAEYLAEKFAAIGQELLIPDFNTGGFTDFTISRQIQQVTTLCADHQPITLIGSSLGGWAALLLAQQLPGVERLVLMAPALGFPSLWLERLGTEALEQWQQAQTIPIYHYTANKKIPLNYQFVTDAQQYLAHDLDRVLPTLIVHGQKDEVVPIAVSRNFCAEHNWVNLLELDSDHGLGDVLDPIWREIVSFCQLDASLNASHPR